MKREVRRTARAISDLTDQFVFLGENNLAVADCFLEAVAKTFDTLSGMPEMGAKRDYQGSSLAGLRMFPVLGFPNHLVFYRPTGSGIEIIRVLHGARDVAALFSAG